tara:strand:+ start:555 stop:713 length:159 start_codon:yes stop_codon:yes gene_type:complete
MPKEKGKEPTKMVGYGSGNKGFESSYSSWKRLNGGKKLTGMQMKLLKIKPVK